MPWKARKERVLSIASIREILGSGTFGQVFKVVNKYTKKHYVIKIIDKARINSQDLKNQLNREKLKLCIHLIIQILWN